MELLGHLKIIVPLDINLVQFDGAKQNQTGLHDLNSWSKVEVEELN